jgi:hypothetical protein
MRSFFVSICVYLAALSLAHTQTIAVANMGTQNTDVAATDRSETPVAVVTTVDEQRKEVAKLLKYAENSLKVDFRQNKGQWNSPALYRMEAPQMRVQFLERGVEFGRTKVNATTQQETGFIWTWTFLRADKDLRLVARNPKGGTNYVVDGWKKVFVAQNSELWYENVWRNTDAYFYGSTADEFLFGFILYPYADPTDIQIHLTGCKACSIVANGDLVLQMAQGEQRMHRPTAYQIIGGEEIKIDIAYKLTDDGELTYAIGDYHDDVALMIQ